MIHTLSQFSELFTSSFGVVTSLIFHVFEISMLRIDWADDTYCFGKSETNDIIFFQLPAGLILFVTNFRLVLENLLKYGILINTEVLRGYMDWRSLPWISCM
jgi:hypothetical protein